MRRHGSRQWAKTEEGRSSILYVLAILPFALTGVLLSGCGSSLAIQPTSTTTPPLTKLVSFNGVTMKVPAYFQVRPINDCVYWADNVIQIGSPTQSNGACVRNPQTGTGVNFSTSATVIANSGNWPISRTVNGLPVVESPPLDVRCLAGCANQALFFVKVPSNDVGILFVANGTVKSGALRLSRAMLSTLVLASATN